RRHFRRRRGPGHGGWSSASRVLQRRWVPLVSTPAGRVLQDGVMTPSADAPASQALFARASAVTPGGVNSPVRAFRAVGGTPRFIRSASGPRLIDVDGREYVDLVGSWGPMLVGHAHPQVMAAVRGALVHGTSYGAPT